MESGPHAAFFDMRTISSYFFLLLFCLLLCFSCNEEQQQKPNPKSQPKKETTLPEISTADIPEVSEERLKEFMETQVGFGPRVPDSKASQQFVEWAIQEFEALNFKVIIDAHKVRMHNGQVVTANNVIAKFNSTQPKRIMLAAHYDSRMIADQDNERQNEAIDGANDGASGVAVLLEIATLLKQNNSNLGIDFVLFDAEDQGSSVGNNPSSWCLGSQAFAKANKAKASTYQFGILFDMVGGEGAVFPKEGYSVAYAPNVVNSVWRIAYQLGYSDLFSNLSASGLIDDHLFINRIMGVPMIDIIDYDQYSGFHETWHTHSDNLNAIDYSIMRRVVEVVTLFLQQQAI